MRDKTKDVKKDEKKENDNTSKEYSYTGDEINTARNFFLNLLDTLGCPTTSQELVTYFNALGLVSCYFYPHEETSGNFKIGQLRVKKHNPYLASIVSVRHALNHPTSSDKVYSAVRTYRAHAELEDRLDGVPLNLKKYVKILESTNVLEFGNYVAGLLDSAAKASAHSIVKVDIKVPRGRRHKFDPYIIARARMYAPEIYKDLPEVEFCVVMKETLLAMEKEMKG